MTSDGSAPSRIVTSSQVGVHPDLEKIVRRHLATSFAKPIAEHAKAGFDDLVRWTQEDGRAVVLDTGCGTGDSTRRLAHRFPDHLVIGIDKSVSRLTRERPENPPGNMRLLRADLVDLYRLIALSDLRIDHHFILYPNPWPKPDHLKRRWHGSPVFPDLVKVGNRITLRTNWAIYAHEFAAALNIVGIDSHLTECPADNPPLTPFEEKYAASRHQLWEVRAYAAT